MSSRRTIVRSALTAVVALGAAAVVGNAWAGPAAKPSYDAEMCYGVAKMGANDCQTASHACAGMSTSNGDKGSWVYVPKGTCEKIMHGSLKAM